MSVETKADMILNDAKVHINSAIKNISKIVVDKISGSDDFSTEYQSKLRSIFYKLIELEKEF